MTMLKQLSSIIGQSIHHIGKKNTHHADIPVSLIISPARYRIANRIIRFEVSKICLEIDYVFCSMLQHLLSCVGRPGGGVGGRGGGGVF